MTDRDSSPLQFTQVIITIFTENQKQQKNVSMQQSSAHFNIVLHLPR